MTGWAPPAGAVAWQDVEGRALVRINGAGLRDDRERALEKPAGTLRVAVLGDSFAEAVQVPVEDAFPAVLERSLAACEALGGRTVEVLNFGVSGYSTAQALLTLRARAGVFRPDLVLLAFFPGNDVVENSRALDSDPMRPYFTEAQGRLVADEGFRDGAAYRGHTSVAGRTWHWLIGRSRLAQAAVKARDLTRLRLRGAAESGGPLDEPGVDERVYRPPEDPGWVQAWEVSEALVTETAREAQAMGARFLLATLSTGAQVHPDRAFRVEFARAHGSADLLYPERRLLALAEREGFPALGLAGELSDLAAVSGAWLHGFPNSLPGIGHWNREGHRLAGQRLANTLCQGWLSGQDSLRPTSAKN
ncbi:MAG: SGNH/GDSL hydrolase family protein [Gammaproteobacteria bacterium]|nr:SGNH/GDSL hydrolase family protein [Gammaproteobacteria bacterium]